MARLPSFERAWNDALATSAALPDDDDAVLAFVEQAIRDAAGEANVSLITRRTGSGATHQLHVEGPSIGHRVIAMTNRAPQGGRLGKQLEVLRKLAGSGVIPIALRNSDFQFKAKSAVSQQVGELIAAGGRTVVLEERELRTIRAARDLADVNPPDFAEWRRIKRPITQLSFIRLVLDLDRVPTAAPPVSAPVVATVVDKPVAQPSTTAKSSGPVAAADPQKLKRPTPTSRRSARRPPRSRCSTFFAAHATCSAPTRRSLRGWRRSLPVTSSCSPTVEL